MVTLAFIPPMLAKLVRTLASNRCPLANLPTTAGGRPPGRHWGEGVPADEMPDYTWLRPEIEAVFKFAEGTAGGLLRHAEFVALREM
jgi:hypothetical protein